MSDAPVAAPLRHAATIALCIALAVGCATAAGSKTPKAGSGDTGAGGIAGRVRYAGPRSPSWSRNRVDPKVCGARVSNPAIAGEQGALANVVVVVRRADDSQAAPAGSGAAPSSASPDCAGKLARYLPRCKRQRRPTPRRQRPLLHHHCQIVPRVVVANVGDELVIRNTDPITHRTKLQALLPSDRAGFPTGRQLFDTPTPPDAKLGELPLDRAGIFDVTCRLHPFTRGYVYVVRGAAWVAVSDKHGRYKIAPLPPGRYSVTIWHEVFGRKRATVQVRAGGVTEQVFRFDGP